MFRIIALVAVVGLLLVPVAVQAQDVTVTPDVVYGHKYGMALTFDVFTPANANGAAVLDMVSGGWRSNPDDFKPKIGKAFLRRGYTLFAVSHLSQP